MIVALLVTTFVIAFVVASIVVVIFSKPIDSILKQVVPSELSYAWARYLRFAIYVVGIGGGVQVWSFEKYLNQQETAKGLGLIELTTDRWMLEIYNTVIGTLQSTAMILLVFFVVALIAVVIVRLFESRNANKTESAK
jgi:hypothetical protein